MSNFLILNIISVQSYSPHDLWSLSRLLSQRMRRPSASSSSAKSVIKRFSWWVSSLCPMRISQYESSSSSIQCSLMWWYFSTSTSCALRMSCSVHGSPQVKVNTPLSSVTWSAIQCSRPCALLICSQIMFGDLVASGYSISIFCFLMVQKYEKSAKYKIFSRKILVVRKKVVPLHPLNRNDGGIAQLVRAHDS